MFEDKTYDNIMNDMLADIDLDVRKDEGSLIFNSLSKQALQLEQAYINLSYLYDQILATTMNKENLIMYGEERGIIYKDGTPCYLECNIFKKTSEEPIEITVGMKFYSGNYTYEISQILDVNGVYEIKCTEPGNIPTQIGRNIYPVDFVNNFGYGIITALRVAGRDDEKVEDYRKRVIESFNPRGFAGNKRAYIDKINEYEGIGGCKVKRRNPETGLIDITVQGSNFDLVPQTLVDKIQQDVDPARDGEGDGWCPICHRVNIQSVAFGYIGVFATIKCQDGYTLDSTMSANLKAEINNYFYDVNKEWANKNTLLITPATLFTYMQRVEGVESILLENTSGENISYVIYKDAAGVKHRSQVAITVPSNAIAVFNPTSEYESAFVQAV